MKNKKIIIIIALVLVAIITTIILVLTNKDKSSYIVKTSLVDAQSPARYLEVYKDGEKIDFKEARYTDDVLLCKGTNPTIHFTELDGYEELKIILKDDKVVIAKIDKGGK